LQEHTGRVFRLQFDEFQIVSSSHDDTILIWDFLNAGNSGSPSGGANNVQPPPHLPALPPAFPVAPAGHAVAHPHHPAQMPPLAHPIPIHPQAANPHLPQMPGLAGLMMPSRSANRNPPPSPPFPKHRCMDDSLPSGSRQHPQPCDLERMEDADSPQCDAPGPSSSHHVMVPPDEVDMLMEVREKNSPSDGLDDSTNREQAEVEEGDESEDPQQASSSDRKDRFFA